MQLLQHFSVLTLHPANAKELKGLILQLAVEGKLTKKWRAENSDVEPASELLKRIQKEKELLIKDKKIKKEKPLEQITDNEKHLDLPRTWVDVRLGNIGDWGAGATPLRSNPEFYGGTINWFKSGELNNDVIVGESNEKITAKALKETSVRLNKVGDVLIAMYGATIGKTSILGVEGTTNQAVCACTCYSPMSNTYLHLLLKALKQKFLDQGEGGAQPNISRVKIRTRVIPLPPLEEQKAIVEVVEELFAEVEQLENATVQRVKLKEQFVVSSLQQLTNADTQREWTALQSHFNDFFNTEPNIKKLRETILQLAVQGKLTQKWRSSHIDVEPASELLQHIQKKKQQLIKEKKIKKEKPLPPIDADDVPYELPEGWEWCRMGEVTEKLGAGSTPSGGKSAYEPQGTMFFRSQNIHNDGHRVDNIAFINQETHTKMKGTHVRAKDILLNITGGSIGRSTLIPDDFDTANVSQHVAIVRMVDLEIREYMHKLIISEQFQQTIMDEQVGVSREGLSMTKLKLFLIPLPPLEEQKAIVRKVNNLMALCDELEQHVAASTQQVQDLMKSCLREVVEG